MVSCNFAGVYEHISTKILRAEFAPLRAGDLFPDWDEKIDQDALTYTYRMVQRIGNAAVRVKRTDEVPIIGLGGQEWPAPIVTLHAAYEEARTPPAALREGLSEITLENERAAREAI